MNTSRPQFLVFIATSLDGYIARPDGALDWLTAPHSEACDGEVSEVGEVGVIDIDVEEVDEVDADADVSGGDIDVGGGDFG